jgi:hypothetical protein
MTSIIFGRCLACSFAPTIPNSTAGNYEFTLIDPKAPCGIYFCSIKTEEGEKTLKLIKSH